MRRIFAVVFIFSVLCSAAPAEELKNEPAVYYKGEEMEISVIEQVSERKVVDVTVLPFWQKDKKAVPAFSGKTFSQDISSALETGDFKAKQGETLLIYPQEGGGEETRLLLLGLGEKKKDAESLRRSFAAAVSVARAKKCKKATFILPATDEKTVEAVSDGVILSNYAFDSLKNECLKEDPTALLEKIYFIGGDKKTLSQIKRQHHIADGVFLTRDLANDNADGATPQELSAQARKLARKFPKVKTTVYGKKEIEKMKMGLLLAVNRGSDRDPAFIVMEYRGNPSSKQKTAIVGKGITFDSGGLNLKPTGHIETMKVDMAGGATILGTLYAAAATNLKANIVGVIPTTENSIGPSSYKPGDVYQSYSGKTVEINNTDAEGRLILADALAYTVDVIKPTRIVDLATLTGAIVIALGEGVTGLFSNDDRLSKALETAGEATGEPVWRLPLVVDYKEELKSTIADLKNCGSRRGSSITASLFLQEFVKDTPWAHLDIGGTAHRDPKHYNTTHATGYGVRLLMSLLEQ